MTRLPMDQATHNKIVSFIWSVADDVLRDLFKHGRYPDTIFPMCVQRRVDVVHQPDLEAEEAPEIAEIEDDDEVLEEAA